MVGEVIMVKVVMVNLDKYFKIMRWIFLVFQMIAPVCSVSVFLLYVDGAMPFLSQLLWGMFVVIGSWSFFGWFANGMKNDEILNLKITKEKMAQLLRDGKEPKEFDLIDGNLVVVEKVNE